MQAPTMARRLGPRWSAAWSGWAVVMAAALSPMVCPVAAHAGVFDDDEARRAILDLRQQRAQDSESANAQIKALSAQVDVLKRSLLEMNSAIEQLRSELAASRGGSEVPASTAASTPCPSSRCARACCATSTGRAPIP